MLKVYWIGYGGSSQLAEDLRPMINELGMSLTTISEWPNADVKWDRLTWLNELKKADIVIIPTKYKEQSAKSNNRLTQALSIGKPVIVSPLPAYVKIINEIGYGIIADTPEEWRNALIYLRDNESARVVPMGIVKNYSIDAIAGKWLDLFNNLEKVDIIIPTYNNLPCLRLCIESIRRCTALLHTVIIVDNGNNPDVQAYLEKQGDIVYVKKNRMTFAQAINCGLQVTTAKYVCVLNDDVIVSHGWLNKMVEACGDNIGAVGLLSNCDKGWLHTYDLKIGEKSLLPGVHTVAEMEPLIEEIYGFKSPYNEIVAREWVAFYCTLIKRSVIDKVGLLDVGFSNSGEDVDFCNRIWKAGYKIVQNYNAFVFHFGAVGRRILESENRDEYQAKDKGNHVYLNDKLNKKHVVIYSGPSWERWDYNSINTTGIGGSETWVVWLSREFYKLGYRVTVFADCSEESKDGGVEWLNYKRYPEYINYHWIDYFITSRTTDSLDYPVRADKIYVMIHDIWLLSDRNKLHLEKVDRFCALSKWHKDFVKDYHKIPEEKLWQTSNGIERARFDKVVERNPYRLIYSSSLDRGLDTLLYLFDFMKAGIPELELHVFYGFDTWKKAAALRNQKWELDKIVEIENGLKKNGVFYHGRVKQDQLAEEFLRSSLWAYPTDFEESNCITALEAQAAGLPVVASNYAGLQTTIGNSGILIGNGAKNESYTREYRVKFFDECMKLLRDRDYWQEWSQKSLDNVKNYTWSNIALVWKKLFES